MYQWRKNQIKKCLDPNDLGPPDMCQILKKSSSIVEPPTTSTTRSLTKSLSSFLFSSSSSSSSAAPSKNDKNFVDEGSNFLHCSLFTHFVIGLDCSSAASVSTYLISILKSVEEDRKKRKSSKNWNNRAEKWEICEMDVFIWNSFEGFDLRVNLRVPGSVAVYWGDVDGTEYTETLLKSSWESSFLSSLLRALCYCQGDSLSHQSPVVCFPCANYILDDSKEKFENLKRICLKFLSLHSLISDDEDIQDDKKKDGSSSFETCCNLLSIMLVRLGRFDECIELFSSIQNSFPPVLLKIANAYRLKKQPRAAIAILHKEIIRMEEENIPSFLAFQARMLLEMGNESMCLEVASLSFQLNPRCFESVYEYCKALIKTKQFGKSLMLMNLFLTESPYGSPETCDAIDELMDSCRDLCQTLPGGGKSYFIGSENSKMFEFPMNYVSIFSTVQKTDLIPFEVKLGSIKHIEIEYKKLETQDDKGSDGKQDANLHNDDDECEDALNMSQRKFYRLLVEIEQQLGWNELVVLRSKVFIMEGESDHKTTQHDATPFRRACCWSLDCIFRLLFTDLLSFSTWIEKEILPRPSEANDSSRIPLTHPSIDEGDCDLLSMKSLKIMYPFNLKLWVERAALSERLNKPLYSELTCKIIQAHCFCPRASFRFAKSLLRAGLIADFTLLIYEIQNIIRTRLDASMICDEDSNILDNGRLNDRKRPSHVPYWLLYLMAKAISQFGLQSLLLNCFKGENVHEHIELVNLIKCLGEECDGFHR